MTFPHLLDIILSKTLVEMFDTDSPNSGESFTEFVRDDLDTGDVLDSLVHRGGCGVGASLELGLDLHGLVITTGHFFYWVTQGAARLSEIFLEYNWHSLYSICP